MTEIWEEYAFERLSEAETATLEEHLLICPTCQAELHRVDEFISMMKQASWQDRPQPVRSWIRGLGYAVASGVAAGGIVAAFILAEGVAFRPKTVTGQAPVELLSLRSGAAGANHAIADRTLDLRIDLADLPGGREYQIEIVDANGRRWWSGEVEASIEWLSAHVGTPLNAGQYWVRLYSEGALVREFGLRAE